MVCTRFPFLAGFDIVKKCIMSKKLRQNLTVGIIIAFIFILSWWGQQIGIPFEKIEAFVVRMGVWGPLVYILILLIPVICAPVPATPFTLIGANLFGWQYGMLYSLAGFALGQSINFSLGRHIGKPLLKRIYAVEQYEKIEKRIPERIEFWVVVLLRLIPNPWFDFFSYLAGMSKIRYATFIIASIVGSLPGTFLWNYFGNRIVEYRFSLRSLGILIIVGTILLVWRYVRKKSWWRKVTQNISDVFDNEV
ncbi:MAG: hypothetical protein UV70_C0020G0004 [Parcubacteria group bacterium GW2011_GWA2_43_13]|nr:MAG: hypothetical protein UV70_C0020G0004 [Parcubacteria group bacterium GW2011_GWA2_43_13]HAZ16904.1 hypothetical protein [Candidatus Jacksonbacteria bacterium]